MIVKNPEYKYKVSYVSKGGKGDKLWTRFSVPDYDKKSKVNTFIGVLAFEHLSLNDGDKVSFIDYQAGASQFRGKQQTTLFVSAGDITVHMAEDDALPEMNTEELPW